MVVSEHIINLITGNSDFLAALPFSFFVYIILRTSKDVLLKPKEVKEGIAIVYVAFLTGAGILLERNSARLAEVFTIQFFVGVFAVSFFALLWFLAKKAWILFKWLGVFLKRFAQRILNRSKDTE